MQREEKPIPIKERKKQYFYQTSPLENYENGNNKNQLQQIFHPLPSEQEINPSKVQHYLEDNKREREIINNNNNTEYHTYTKPTKLWSTNSSEKLDNFNGLCSMCF